ncbi:MAG TPA: hypothetical protein VFX25_23020 [Streptosporangiaceae bacterium]|nr:hypothetical protein [Streptosporangiaceae bacterium]
MSLVLRIGSDDEDQQQGPGDDPCSASGARGLHEGDEADVIEDRGTLRIVRSEASPTRGQRLTARMRGRATTTMSTDELLELLRGE